MSPESGALHFRDQLEGKELRVKPDDIKVETMKVKTDKNTGKKNITSVDKFVERITVARKNPFHLFHCTMIIDMIHITLTVSKVQFFSKIIILLKLYKCLWFQVMINLSEVIDLTIQ